MKDNIVYFLEGNLGGIQKAVADFSDDELFMRSVPAANSPAWQIGHLILSERNFIKALRPGLLPELPAGFEASFSKDMTGSNDRSQFPDKAVILDQLAKTRQALVSTAASLTEEELVMPMPGSTATPPPTIGRRLVLQLTHAATHHGQIQVARRALNKPVLF